MRTHIIIITKVLAYFTGVLATGVGWTLAVNLIGGIQHVFR